MKKIFFVFSVFSLLLVSCGEKNDVDPEAEVLEIDTETEVADETDTLEEEAFLPYIETENIRYIEPVQLSSADLIRGMGDYEEFYKEEINTSSYLESQYSEEEVDVYIQSAMNLIELWETGVFKKGEYVDQSLVSAQIALSEGPGARYIYRFALDKNTNTMTLLKPYSHQDEDLSKAQYLHGMHIPVSTIDETIYLEDFEVPEELDLYENTKVKTPREPRGLLLTNSNFAAEDEYFLPEGLSYNFVKYYERGGCIQAFTADGVIYSYTVFPAEFEDPEESDLFTERKEVEFIDLNGVSTLQEYSISSESRCGFSFAMCLSMVEATEEEESKLVKIGTFGTYEAWSLNEIDENTEVAAEYDAFTEKTKMYYQNYLMKREYDETLQEEPLVSLQGFIQSNDFFFIKLDNDKYLPVKTPDLESSAECGKPVIYLYPEKNSLVNVQVGIDQFTETIPTYGLFGWMVYARPNGLLTNLSDQKQYPYLFWEGYSEKNIPLVDSWTLEIDRIEAELPKVLQGLGLNEKETADFLEFWIPKILEEKLPYIEFSFVPKEMMDQVAPLKISPKPDTVIRVFMVYRPTSEPGSSVPRYTARERKGFTVIEWGGALR